MKALLPYMHQVIWRTMGWKQSPINQLSADELEVTSCVYASPEGNSTSWFEVYVTPSLKELQE